MDTLSRRFNCPVGLSDHSEGIYMAPAAVAMGASVVEKHFTTDRRRPGPDHHFALEPGELRQMVDHIRDVELASATAAATPTPSANASRLPVWRCGSSLARLSQRARRFRPRK